MPKVDTVTISLERYEQLKKYQELNNNGKLLKEASALMKKIFEWKNGVITNEERRILERSMNEFINKVDRQ